MIPTPRLVWLAALGLPLALLGLFGRTGLLLVAAYDTILGILVVADRLAAGDPGRLLVEREVPTRWVQGRAGRVVLRCRWRGRRRTWLRIRDLAPVSFDVSASRFVILLGAFSGAEVGYDATPRERGKHAFGVLAVRARGPLGLVERGRLQDLPASVRVYPDLMTLSAREVALASPSSWRGGTRRARLPGEGREFHQLRDYVPGDDVRFVDWKAYAHRARPTLREYRAERNQRVLLMLDAGRLMTARVADRLRFDWAVQAAGRLARVALARGDLVGLAVFSREVKLRLPAARGTRHLGEIAELLAEARPDLDEPDLGRALHSLLRVSSRRTLVVVFTEIADPRAATAVVRYIGSLAPRHLGLVVTLADADLEAERVLPVTDVDAAFRRVAADELWQDYVRTELSLQSRGVLVVRARADALAAEAVERYVEVKTRGRL